MQVKLQSHVPYVDDLRILLTVCTGEPETCCSICPSLLPAIAALASLCLCFPLPLHKPVSLLKDSLTPREEGLIVPCFALPTMT